MVFGFHLVSGGSFGWTCEETKGEKFFFFVTRREPRAKMQPNETTKERKNSCQEEAKRPEKGKVECQSRMRELEKPSRRLF